MYRQAPPAMWFALAFALVGGVFLALGNVVAGAVLVGLAVICGWAMDRTRRGGDDHSGMYDR